MMCSKVWMKTPSRFERLKKPVFVGLWLMWLASFPAAAQMLESFEYGVPPPGWIKTNLQGGSGWYQLPIGTMPLPGWGNGTSSVPPAAGAGTHNAYCSWNTGGGASEGYHNDQWLISPRLTGLTATSTLSYWLKFSFTNFPDTVYVRLSTNGPAPANFTFVVYTNVFPRGGHFNQFRPWSNTVVSLGNLGIPEGTPVWIAIQEYEWDNTHNGAAVELDVISSDLTAAPEPRTSPTSRTFTAYYDGSNPAEQTFTLQSVGSSGMGFSRNLVFGAGPTNWLTIGGPSSGTLAFQNSQAFTASVSVAGLDLGTYCATNIITVPGATNSPLRVPITFNVIRRPQTIVFPNPGPQYTTNKVGLAGTASSGLPVTFSVFSGPGSLAGATNLSFTGTGTVKVVGWQLGNVYYDVAPCVTNAFAVTKPGAMIVFTNLSHEYDGSPHGATITTVPAGLTVDTTYNGSPALPVAIGSYAVTSTVDDTFYGGIAVATFTITKMVQTIDFPNPGPQWATSHVGLAATASSGLPVTFAAIGGPALISGGTNLAFTRGGLVTITASQAGDAQWAAAAATNTFRVVGVYTLAVQSAHGTPYPAVGIHTNLEDAILTNRVTAPPVENGTQFVYTGWVLDGNEPHTGAATSLVMTVTNHAVLTWNWLTNVLFTVNAGAHGQVLGDAGGWYEIGGSVTVTAVADGGCRFIAWTGDVPAGQTNQNPLTLVLDCARTVAAVFGRLEAQDDAAATGIDVPVVVPVLANDLPAAAGDVLTVTNVTQGANGSVAVSGGGATVTYTPRAGWYGGDRFAYWVSDGLGGSDTAGVSVVVSPPLTNLALASRGSTIVGSNGGNHGQLIDGITNGYNNTAGFGYTYWSGSTNIPGKMTLDLKSLCTIYQVRLLLWDLDSRYYRYKIEASSNGTAWVTVENRTTGTWRGWQDIAFGVPVLARYLRLTGTYNSANKGFHVVEWEVYGAPPPPPAPAIQTSVGSLGVPEGSTTNFQACLTAAPANDTTVTVTRAGGDTDITVQSGTLLVFTPADWSTWQEVTLAAAEDADSIAGSATIRCSSPGLADRDVAAVELDNEAEDNLALASRGSTIAGNNGANWGQLIDGVTAGYTKSTGFGYTYWRNAANAPGRMTLDLQGLCTITQIKLLLWNLDSRYYRYRIEASSNNTTWVTVVDRTAGTWRGWQDIAFGTPVRARYLRLTGTYNSVNDGFHIVEWEVYGAVAAGASAKRVGTAPAGGEGVPVRPIDVRTSDPEPDTNGWKAVDGDVKTCWAPGADAAGAWMVLTYDEAVLAEQVNVVWGGNSPTNLHLYVSLDPDKWFDLAPILERGPASFRYLWLVMPDDGSGAVPEVSEIEVRGGDGGGTD